jgi:hypothetical protein
MGIALVLALITIAAAGASGGDKKQAPKVPTTPPADDKPVGDPVFPSDDSKGAPEEPKKEGIRFIDIGPISDNPVKATGDWPGIKGLPQPHRNLALNVTSDVLYRALKSGGSICWKGTCSSAAVLGAINAIDAAIGISNYPLAERELRDTLRLLRAAGK